MSDKPKPNTGDLQGIQIMKFAKKIAPNWDNIAASLNNKSFLPALIKAETTMPDAISWSKTFVSKMKYNVTIEIEVLLTVLLENDAMDGFEYLHQEFPTVPVVYPTETFERIQPNIINELAPLIGDKWQDICIQLEIDPDNARKLMPDDLMEKHKPMYFFELLSKGQLKNQKTNTPVVVKIKKLCEVLGNCDVDAARKYMEKTFSHAKN